MKQNLLIWSAVLGAISTHRVLSARPVWYRCLLRPFANRERGTWSALGLPARWCRRNRDDKGSRPSWHEFYVEDVDRLHCPLDPDAPETEAYLGRKYSDMDMAFYAGMGFDGYRLALQTSWHVDFNTKQLRFDGRYVLEPSPELKAKLDVYGRQHFVPKEDYYATYGSALSVLFDRISGDGFEGLDDDTLERVAAGCLILLCGGHRGCSKHITSEEEFSAQMESLIIFNHAKNVISGVTLLEKSATPRIHAVS